MPMMPAIMRGFYYRLLYTTQFNPQPNPFRGGAHRYNAQKRGLSMASHFLSTKQESWLKLGAYGRARIPTYIHTALLWVKEEYNQKTLFDAAMFCIMRGLLTLLPNPNNDPPTAQSATTTQQIIDRIEKLKKAA
jgi:hypothetical protein